MEITDILIYVVYLNLIISRATKIYGCYKYKIVEKSSLPWVILMNVNNVILIIYSYLLGLTKLYYLYSTMISLETILFIMVIYYSFFNNVKQSNHFELNDLFIGLKK